MRTDVRAALAAVWCLGLAATASAAPVPVGVSEKRLRELYNDLGGKGTNRVRAALVLATTPKETVAFLGKTLNPVYADEKHVDQWIADVTSDDEARWSPAMEKLNAVSALQVVQTKLYEALRTKPTGEPMRRLAMITLAPYRSMNDAWGLSEFDWKDVPPDRITIERGQKHLGVRTVLNRDPKLPGVMRPTIQLDVPEGACVDTFHYVPWYQCIAALDVLEHINTPEAVAVIRAFAEGHPDALPTKAAQEALARLKKKGP